ncbi:hypothetical protein FEM05_35810, partial [Pseudomonas aeruginosa]
MRRVPRGPRGGAAAPRPPGADAPGARWFGSASAPRRNPMKHPVLALLGLLVVVAAPVAHAVEI